MVTLLGPKGWNSGNYQGSQATVGGMQRYWAKIYLSWTGFFQHGFPLKEGGSLDFPKRIGDYFLGFLFGSSIRVPFFPNQGRFTKIFTKRVWRNFGQEDCRTYFGIFGPDIYPGFHPRGDINPSFCWTKGTSV